MKRKRVILPINEKPSMITCIHHAYPCAIIESKELAEVIIKDYKNTEWKRIEYNTELFFRGERVKAVEKGNDINAFVLWRDLAEKDELIVKIDYLKPRNIDYYIDFFVFKEEHLDQVLEMEDKSKAFRWNPYGVFIQKDMYAFDTKHYRYMKMTVEGKQMQGRISPDGQNWMIINTISLSDIDNLKIGIHGFLGKDSFGEWRQMNFIQMVYNTYSPHKGIHLDYYVCPRKNIDNSYGWFSSYLDTCYDILYDAVDMFGDLQKYIQWQIAHQYYVNICLDEYFVPDRMDYHKNHYNHFNLFYGYDLKKQVYYVLGYGEKSIPMLSEIPFADVTAEVIASERIVRYKYAPSEIGNPKFEISAVINGLFDYLNNVDSSKKIANIMLSEDIKYGISIFDDLLSVDICRQQIRQDKRIPFCILEHNKFMKERVLYLSKNGFLSDEETMHLADLCNNAIRNATILMSLMVKNILNEKCSERIDSYIRKVYELEKQICEELYTYLTEKKEKD